MNPTEKIILALDLGATNFRVAAVDRQGNILSRHRDATNAHEGQHTVLSRLMEAVRLVMAQFSSSQVAAVSAAAPGIVDAVQGVLVLPPNLPNWRHVPLRAVMEKELGIPSFVNNDASLAAQGEHRFGAGTGLQHLIYFTWSSGIGAGVITDGQLLLGAHGFAGEPGHMIVEPGGSPCGCGGQGCLEAVASGLAIARMAHEDLEKGTESSMATLTKNDQSSITAEVVAQAAASGDKLAQDVLSRAATYMGVGVVNLIHLFDPQRVIIGGGISNIGEPVFAAVRRIVNQYSMPDFIKGSEIVPAALGDDAGLLGAATWAFDRIGP